MVSVDRTQHYSVSVRPSQINGRVGAELWVTLRTTECQWRCKTGGCAFCGLGKLDKDFLRSLPLSEAREQVTNFFGEFIRLDQRPEEIFKLSFISMSSSLLDPLVIDFDALKAVVEISFGYLPEVSEVSFESRPEWVNVSVLGQLDSLLSEVYHRKLVREIALGIETHDEARRLQVGKGITDSMIFDLGETLAGLDWKLRAYFMYNMLMRDKNRQELIGNVELMARLRDETGVSPSILILRGYVPEGMENDPVFQGFKEVPDKTALSELREAAIRAKELDVPFEIDSTSEDQGAVGADVLSLQYTAALERYNCSFNPDDLYLKES